MRESQRNHDRLQPDFVGPVNRFGNFFPSTLLNFRRANRASPHTATRHQSAKKRRSVSRYCCITGVCRAIGVGADMARSLSVVGDRPQAQPFFARHEGAALVAGSVRGSVRFWRQELIYCVFQFGATHRQRIIVQRILL